MNITIFQAFAAGMAVATTFMLLAWAAYRKGRKEAAEQERAEQERYTRYVDLPKPALFNRNI